MKQKIRLGDCYALTKHKLKPYKIRYFSLLAVLTAMCLYAVKQVSAQKAEPAATAVADIKPLQIGDTIPEYLWHLPLQVVNYPPAGGKDTITLNDYRDQLIILDFWATWCKPCISSLYKLDTLQKQFADEIAVIPTTYEAREKAGEFIANKGWSLPSAVGDTILKKYFPHQSIPHQVWIKSGRVEAIVGPEYARANMIRDVLAGKHVAFNHKIEVPFDKMKPLFINGNGGNGSNMLYQSVISGRLNARVAGVSRPSPNQILAYNQTIRNLYLLAVDYQISPLYSGYYIDKFIAYDLMPDLKYKVDPSEVISQKDPLKLERWADSNLYSYNLVLPEGTDSTKLQGRMLDDLNDFFGARFGLKVKYDQRNREALALAYAGAYPEILTNGGEAAQKVKPGTKNTMILKNQPMHVLIHFLNNALASEQRPIVDETGINTNIDIEINLDDTDIIAIKKELSAYGLQLVEKAAQVKMIIFSDNQSKSQKHE